MCSFNRLKCKNINKKDVPNVSYEDIKLTSSSKKKNKKKAKNKKQKAKKEEGILSLPGMTRNV